MKKVNVLKLVFVVLMSMMILPIYVGAEEQKWNCEITIDADKHDFYNRAYPTDGCTSSAFTGFWDGESGALLGSYTGQVSNGEIVDLGVEYVKVTVIPPKKPDPKPEPEKPKDPKPEKPKDPKPEKPKDPKPDPKPKPEKDKGKNEGSNNKNKGNNSGSSGGSKTPPKSEKQSKIVHLKTSTSHHQVQVIIKVKEIANQVIAQAINQMLLKQ